MRQKKRLKQLNKILNKVKSHKIEMEKMSNEELATLTKKFKTRLNEGETLDDILPEVYAAICEADKRILGKSPYDVQILGGIALHQGNLIEMNTGEGKTLVATMPLYLNALTGKSTILLTNNDYLAVRDAKEMGPVFKFMGLSVGTGVQERAEDEFTNDDKREIYECDIVYTTHSVFGFDYLLNNLVTSASERFMRELYYVIIDEADAVLLDSAQTPLVISGSPRVQSNLYQMANFFVTTLEEGRDYEKEDNKVWLTKEGVKYTEKYFNIDNFYGEEYFEINRHVTLALRAHVLFEIEKQYMISNDGEIQLLDSGSGRMMPGVKLRGGQHQALETKEGLKISNENRSVASITYQNLFLLFPKMAGMSGTISDASAEIKNVYGSDVVIIPPNCMLNRKDLKDLYFKDIYSQFEAAIELVKETHSTGQPVLIVVSTIGETEIVSKLLVEENIPHSVLNANNAFWEVEIIKEAGQINTVTVATSMAGRGTDIRLGEGVKELGGLAVIGIGRMANIRQERQARGRAGRQGDPGFSRFFVSLQDEVVKNIGRIDSQVYANGNKYISKRRLKRIINISQKITEEFAVISRKYSMSYDEVLQRQRKVIYETRNGLLDGEHIEVSNIIEVAKRNIEKFVNNGFKNSHEMSKGDVTRYILDNISYELNSDIDKVDFANPTCIRIYLTRLVLNKIYEKRKSMGEKEANDFMRIATLHAIDNAWVEQVDYLQQLQAAVSGRSYAQRNPLFEYQNDSLESFRRMEAIILEDMIRNILLGSVYYNSEGDMKIIIP